MIFAIGLGLIFLALCVAIAFTCGITGIARGRQYKTNKYPWCFWRWTDVPTKYILRLHIVKTPWFAICLHWIAKPDPEPYLHDHPVTFLSLVLRGGYAEIRQKAGDLSPSIHVHRWFNFIRAEERDRHRIIFTRRNTLTLCFMGPKRREWGYHVFGRWIYWKDYDKQKAELGDPPEWPFFFKKLNERVDQLSEDFIAKYNGKIFIDEEVRHIDNRDASGPIVEMKACLTCGLYHSTPSEFTSDGLSDFCSRTCLQDYSSLKRMGLR